MSKNVKRQHLTKEGRVKVPYADEAGASDAADRMTKRFGQRFDFYSCGLCENWHVGRMRSEVIRRRRMAIWMQELGPRVAHNLDEENRGPARERQQRIVRRARRLAGTLAG